MGNKSDLFLDQKVSELEGKNYAQKNNAIFAQLSAKDNRLGIVDYINKLVSEYFENENHNKNKKNNEFIKKEKGIILSNEKINNLGYNKSGCCGGKAKARRKKYEDLLEQNNGEINSIFLGCDGVGKTSLIKRIDGKDFNENEEHTEDLKKYETKYFNSTMEINLNIYDINNEKIKNFSVENILKKCQIYFLVYDLNDLRSVEEVKIWLNIIKNLKVNEPKNNYVISIIGNKNDLLDDEQKMNINNIEVKNFKENNLINEINTIFFSTTAKSNNNEIKEIIGIAVEKFINLP